jgi:hypothetical protein
MPFGNNGREFDLENLLSKAEAFDLSREDAKAIYRAFKATILNWRPLFSAHGLANSDLKYLSNAFNHWETLPSGS